MPEMIVWPVSWSECTRKVGSSSDSFWSAIASLSWSAFVFGSMAFKEAAKRAHPVLLEPMMNVEVVCPDAYMGDILGDLSSRRGKIGGMTQRGEAQVIAASVPLSEMFGYATDLRSATQGRATYTMQFERYSEVPSALSEEISEHRSGTLVGANA